MSAVKRLLCVIGLHPYGRIRRTEYAVLYRCPCCARSRWKTTRGHWIARQRARVIQVQEIQERHTR